MEGSDMAVSRAHTLFLFLLLPLFLIAACAQEPGAGGGLGDPLGASADASRQGVEFCYRSCHQMLPSTGYGPWDASGWYSHAGTALIDSPQYASGVLLSTVSHPGWGATPYLFDPGLKVWYLDSTQVNDAKYYFRTRGTIEATHFGQYWVTSRPYTALLYEAPAQGTSGSIRQAVIGYVDMKYAAPANGGIVDSADPDACTASCHRPHPGDQGDEARQWAMGGHRPKLVSVTRWVSNYPAGFKTSSTVQTSLGFWAAVEGSSFALAPGATMGTPSASSYCLNCHSSQGFADQAPDSMTTMSFHRPQWTYPGGGSLLACNSCHDGLGPQTAEEPRLRFTGKAKFFGLLNNESTVQSYVSSVDGLGRSAVCVYCHSGRGGCKPQIDDDNARNIQRSGFRSRHDTVGGLLLIPGNGIAYELTNRVYIGSLGHARIGCIGCHMAPPPGPDAKVGGHTHLVINDADGSDNFPACKSEVGCHVNATAMKAITNHTADWDSNSATITAKAEVAFLFSTMVNTIKVFPTGSTTGAWATISSSASIATPSGSPMYNGSVPDPAKAAALRIAGFNYNVLRQDAGKWAHSAQYSAQLMRDTIDLLRANMNTPWAPLKGVRP
jgi:hypothetical protein